MKALVINQYGGPEQLQVQDVSLPLSRRGEVLVRVHAAGINPVDYKIRNGSLKIVTGSKFPFIPGQDIAGVVEQASEKSIFRPGDKVFAMLPKKGGYAEFVSVDERHLCHIPEGFSMTEAAATPLVALTALKMLLTGERINAGDRILVNGASGGVGSFAVQIANAMGARVTGVCSTTNTEFVRGLGAEKVIDYTREDFTKSETKYRKIIDAVAKSSFGKCRKILEENGNFVSTLPGNGVWFHQAFNFTRSKKANIVMVKPSGHYLQLIAEFMSKGQLRPFIQNTFTINQGAEAHKMIETHRVRGKIVFQIIP